MYRLYHASNVDSRHSLYGACSALSVVGMNRAGAWLNAEREGAAQEGGTHIYNSIDQVLHCATSVP